MDFYAKANLVCEVLHSWYKGTPLNSNIKQQLMFLLGSAGAIAAIKQTLPKLTKNKTPFEQQTTFLIQQRCDRRAIKRFVYFRKKLLALEQKAISSMKHKTIVKADVYTNFTYKSYLKALATAKRKVSVTKASFHIEKLKTLCSEVKFNIHCRFGCQKQN